MFCTVNRCRLKQSAYFFLFSVVLTVFNRGRSCQSVVDQTQLTLTSGDEDQLVDRIKSGSVNISAVMSRKLFKYMSYHVRKSAYPGVSIYTSFTIARLNVLPMFDAAPLVAHFIPVINDVTSFNYPIDLTACRTVKKKEELSLFVGVISAPGNAEKRKVIRETWAESFELKLNALSKSAVSVVNFAFIIGRSPDNETNRLLDVESAQFGDILQVEMMDTYYNITVKVTGLLRWLDLNCAGVDFVLKVDDDVFVNSRNLGAFIHQVNPLALSVYGENADGIVGRGTLLIFDSRE